MESLALIKAILLASSAVTAAREGGIHANEAPQRDPLPNVVIMSTGSNDDSDKLTHSGPNGLLNERVRIWAQAKTANAALALGVAIDRALHGYSGNVSGAHVQLVEKLMTLSDFQSNATVQRAIIDVRIHWTRAA